MKKIFLFLVCSMSVLLAYAQKSTSVLNSGRSSYYDTVKAKSEDCFVFHYHEVSRDRKKQMLYSDGADIFNDSVNKFSRIIISDGVKEIDLPTIPLENIIILDDKKIIVGLTRIEVSPYLVVIYNFKGELLYKGNLGALTLKLEKSRFKQLVTKYPKVLDCMEKSDCFKEGDTCFVELSSCMLNSIGRDNARQEFLNEIILGHYIPFQTVSSQGLLYTPYRGFYRYSNPFHDIIMIGSVPYLLILNTEDGKQVNIPLISNCDLKQELEGRK